EADGRLGAGVDGHGRGEHDPLQVAALVLPVEHAADLDLGLRAGRDRALDRVAGRQPQLGAVGDRTGEGLTLGVVQGDAVARGDGHARGGGVDHVRADEVANVALGDVGRGDRQAHRRLAAARDVAAVEGLEDRLVVGLDVVGGDVRVRLGLDVGQVEAVAVVPDGGLDG